MRYLQKHLGYRQPFEHSIKWYHKDFKQCPAAVEAWKDNHYRLVDMWFKHFNGKAAAFTLYQERFSPGRGIWWTPEYRRMAKPRF